MLFPIGWGQEIVNDWGATLTGDCPNCHRRTWVHFRASKTFFTIFLIPVIPYKSENRLFCSVCKYGKNLTDGAAWRACQLSQAASAYRANKMPESDYLGMVAEAQLWP